MSSHLGLRYEGPATTTSASFSDFDSLYRKNAPWCLDSNESLRCYTVTDNTMDSTSSFSQLCRSQEVASARRPKTRDPYCQPSSGNAAKELETIPSSNSSNHTPPEVGANCAPIKRRPSCSSSSSAELLEGELNPTAAIYLDAERRRDRQAGTNPLDRRSSFELIYNPQATPDSIDFIMVRSEPTCLKPPLVENTHPTNSTQLTSSSKSSSSMRTTEATSFTSVEGSALVNSDSSLVKILCNRIKWTEDRTPTPSRPCELMGENCDEIIMPIPPRKLSLPQEPVRPIERSEASGQSACERPVPLPRRIAVQREAEQRVAKSANSLPEARHRSACSIWTAGKQEQQQPPPPPLLPPRARPSTAPVWTRVATKRPAMPDLDEHSRLLAAEGIDLEEWSRKAQEISQWRQQVNQALQVSAAVPPAPQADVWPRLDKRYPDNGVGELERMYDSIGLDSDQQLLERAATREAMLATPTPIAHRPQPTFLNNNTVRGIEEDSFVRVATRSPQQALPQPANGRDTQVQVSRKEFLTPQITRKAMPQDTRIARDHVLEGSPRPKNAHLPQRHKIQHPAGETRSRQSPSMLQSSPIARPKPSVVPGARHLATGQPAFQSTPPRAESESRGMDKPRQRTAVPLQTSRILYQGQSNGLLQPSSSFAEALSLAARANAELGAAVDNCSRELAFCPFTGSSSINATGTSNNNNKHPDASDQWLLESVKQRQAPATNAPASPPIISWPQKASVVPASPMLSKKRSSAVMMISEPRPCDTSCREHQSRSLNRQRNSASLTRHQSYGNEVSQQGPELAPPIPQRSQRPPLNRGGPTTPQPALPARPPSRRAAKNLQSEDREINRLSGHSSGFVSLLGHSPDAARDHKRESRSPASVSVAGNRASLPPSASVWDYPKVTNLGAPLRQIRSRSESNDRTQPLREDSERSFAPVHTGPNKFLLGRIASNDDICIETETPFALNIAASGRNICIAKMASADDLDTKLAQNGVEGVLASAPPKRVPVSLRLTFGSDPSLRETEEDREQRTRYRSVCHVGLPDYVDEKASEGRNRYSLPCISQVSRSAPAWPLTKDGQESRPNTAQPEESPAPVETKVSEKLYALRMSSNGNGWPTLEEVSNFSEETRKRNAAGPGPIFPLASLIVPVKLNGDGLIELPNLQEHLQSERPLFYLVTPDQLKAGYSESTSS